MGGIGSIAIDEVDDIQIGSAGAITTANGDITVNALSITTGNTISTGTNGSITFATGVSGGADDITISNAVTAAGAGIVTLNANDALTVNAAVGSTSGNLDLDAGTTIAFDMNGDLTTAGAGSIDVNAAGTTLTMADGTIFDTSGGTGAVNLVAGTDIALGQITSGGAAIVIAGGGAASGAITDTTLLEDVGNENVSGTAIILTSIDGVGDATAAGDKVYERVREPATFTFDIVGP